MITQMNLISKALMKIIKIKIKEKVEKLQKLKEYRLCIVKLVIFNIVNDNSIQNTISK
jgi:hypothetical protein